MLSVWSSCQSILVSVLYTCTVTRLNKILDLTFVVSVRFLWKVAVIVAVSSMPLYIIKLIRSRVAPAASSKLV